MPVARSRGLVATAASSRVCIRGMACSPRCWLAPAFVVRDGVYVCLAWEATPMLCHAACDTPPPMAAACACHSLERAGQLSLVLLLGGEDHASGWPEGGRRRTTACEVGDDG